jgi:hypothetical protein
VRAPEGGSVTLALTEDDGTLRATGTLDRLRGIAARGCPHHPNSGTGDGTSQDCGCAVLDRPPATGAYTPTAAQQAFVRTRDRSCRMPTCGQRVGWADADHLTPHARGGRPTAPTCAACAAAHHRLKTHARGWHFEMDPDGTLTVTTPSGITRTTPTRHPATRHPATGGTSTTGTRPATRRHQTTRTRRATTLLTGRDRVPATQPRRCG